MSQTNLDLAIKQFNQREFYACHDTLEEIWLESIEPDKTFYQGILQVAVGCYHFGNGNWRGAVILLGEGMRKLISYEPDYLEVDVTQLTDQSNDLLIALQKIEPETVTQFYQQLLDRQLENNLDFPVIQTIS